LICSLAHERRVTSPKPCAYCSVVERSAGYVFERIVRSFNDELIPLPSLTMRIVEPFLAISSSSSLSEDGTRTSTNSNGKYPGFGRLVRQFEPSEREIKYPPPREMIPGIERYFATALRGDGSLALDSSERKADQSFAWTILIPHKKGQT